MIVFLALQALIFAIWAVLSFSILAAMVLRRVRNVRGAGEGPDPVPYLSDPFTHFRRRVWMGATVLLAVCLMVSGVLFLGL